MSNRNEFLAVKLFSVLQCFLGALSVGILLLIFLVNLDYSSAIGTKENRHPLYRNDDVIPNAREAHARFHQRVRRAEGSAPLHTEESKPIALHLGAGRDAWRWPDLGHTVAPNADGKMYSHRAILAVSSFPARNS